MRLSISLLLLAVAAHGVSSRSSKKVEEGKTEKRALAEGNAGVEKRAPVLPTALPSVASGIEYAETKDVHSDKSPVHQVYATPVPQIAKISDVLTGQGQYQAAIVKHLYSPVSVYQPRLGSPTIYEVSSPIPSQLAYSEHKIAYQPPQNAIQYTPQLYQQKLQVQKQNFARIPVNYQTQPQPIFVQQVAQTQPIIARHLAPAQQIYQQIPQVNYQNAVPYQGQIQQFVPYQQNHQIPYEGQQQQQLVYLRQNLVQVPQHSQAQAGIVYAREEQSREEQAPQKFEQPEQQQPQQQEKIEKQTVAAQSQNYNIQPVSQPAHSQSAISFASFSQSQPEQHVHYRPQVHANLQVQSTPAPQHVSPTPETSANIVAPAKILPAPGKTVYYLRQSPAQVAQPQQYYQPIYSQSREVVQLQNPGYSGHPVPVPTFAPVQYFGKFAQSIFGNYQH